VFCRNPEEKILAAALGRKIQIKRLLRKKKGPGGESGALLARM